MSNDLPLHLCIRPLLLEDLDQVIELEKLGFPPEERAQPESIKQRLLLAPELSSGLFVRKFEVIAKDTTSYSPEPRSTITEERLIGHIMATKLAADEITLDSMSKHVETGKNVGIHSVVIHPDYQKKNLATLLLHDYIQKLSNQEIGEKLVLIAHENLVPFYARIGFVNKGKSSLEYGGVEWFNLSRTLVKELEDEE